MRKAIEYPTDKCRFFVVCCLRHIALNGDRMPLGCNSLPPLIVFLPSPKCFLRSCKLLVLKPLDPVVPIF
jgi:hypothetical protein